MAVATLDGLLTSLQAIEEERLAVLDDTCARELAWLRGLFAADVSASAVDNSSEALEAQADCHDDTEKENEVAGQPKRKGRQPRKAAPQRRTGRKGKATAAEAGVPVQTTDEVDSGGEARVATAGAKLQAVPEGDEEAAEEVVAEDVVCDWSAEEPQAEKTPRVSSATKASDAKAIHDAKATIVASTPSPLPEPSMRSVPLSCRRFTRSASRRSASQVKSTPEAKAEASRMSVPEIEVVAEAPRVEGMATVDEPESANVANNASDKEAEEVVTVKVASVDEAETAVQDEPMGTPVTGPQKELPKFQALTPLVVVNADVLNNGTGSTEIERGGSKSPVAAGSQRKRSLADTTPLVEINEQLRTASKTVSCRKKRPKTPKDDFGFPVQSTINLLYSQAKEQSSLEFKLEPPSEDMETPRLCPTQHSIFSAGKSSRKPTPPRVQGSTEFTACVPSPAPLSTEDVPMLEQTVISAAPTAEPSEKVSTDDVIPATPEADTDSSRPSESSHQVEAASAPSSSDSGGSVPAKSLATADPQQSNIVSGFASFVPLVKPQQVAAPPPAAGRAHVKVKALEAANAARKEAEAKAAERARRLEAGKQRREAARQAPAKRPPVPLIAKPSRLAGKPVHGPSRLGQSATSKDSKGSAKPEAAKSVADIQAQRRAQEEAERQARKEKMKRMEEQMEKIKKEKKDREAARLADKNGVETNGKKQVTVKTTEPQPVHVASQKADDDQAGKTVKTPPKAAATTATEVATEASYEISPYKSGSDSDDEDDHRRSRKPVPLWAQTVHLVQQLTKQQYVDPDEIFKQKHIKTCSLDDMFRDNPPTNASKAKNLSRRGSSGNWIEDRVTWQEELAYKKAMGFRAFC